MANYREKMREYLKEPNEYSNQYGKWGALNVEQRKLIRRLLDEMDSADAIIKKQYEEKQRLIYYLKERIEETDKTRKLHKMYSLSEERLSSKYYAFCEVLDFVNKRGKNE